MSASARASRLRWYYANRERSMAASRRWKAENVERAKKSAKQYRERHKTVLAAGKKKWREDNLDRVTAVKRAWRDSNRERERAGCKAWRAKNLDSERKRARENMKQYAAKHPGRVAHQKRADRARRRGATGRHSHEDVAAILKMQGGRCAYCTVKLRKYHVDHITPAARGGSDERRNIQILCKPCNLRKHARDPVVFAQSLGLLL